MLNKEICLECYTKRYGQLNDFSTFHGHLYDFHNGWDKKHVCWCILECTPINSNSISIYSEIPDNCDYKLEQILKRDEDKE